MNVDAALIAATAEAQEQRREAKRQRARAMDIIVDLLLERGRTRQLLERAAAALANTDALNGRPITAFVNDIREHLEGTQ